MRVQQRRLWVVRIVNNLSHIIVSPPNFIENLSLNHEFFNNTVHAGGFGCLQLTIYRDTLVSFFSGWTNTKIAAG